MYASIARFWLFCLTFVCLHDKQHHNNYALCEQSEEFIENINIIRQQKSNQIKELRAFLRAQAATDVTAATISTRQSPHTSVDDAESHGILSNGLKDNLAKLLSKTATTQYNFQSSEDSNQKEFLMPTTRQLRIVHDKLHYTSELHIKQGRLMGLVRHFQNSTGLSSVNQFLGIPYAEAPVGSRRFMPPGAPLPWQGLKVARHLPPSCPQKLPDVSAQSGAHMSPGRYEHLTRLLPYLRNESEDCLYLNLYVPSESEPDQTFPVVVYIHGESFEWNSGNAYDGSVMASYGKVIVVTLNYRLGILGFMKPSISDSTVGNFGLLDQIAALHWIKENIAFFNGDKQRVTLMGHNTGAACINYLMVSPVSAGLFHRAILMSGSAMSSWANTKQANKFTIQIAKNLNCPLNDANEQMLSCLRQKDYRDILKMQRPFPKFLTPMTPIVDGYVIPNDPAKAMEIHTENFHSYDLMFGVTESESYHTIGSLALKEGFREDERDSIMRSYMQNRFEIRPDLALAATLKKYNDIYTNPMKGTNLEHRDLVLDMLSDATVVGPLIQTGLYHADVNRNTFMYVFGHNSMSGQHFNVPYSVSGEELAFVFGAPLAPAGPFHNNYSAQEKLLSEAVLTYWTNFAKTGNPKTPWKDSFINLYPMEWNHYDVDWPEFNKRSQAYINIGIPPSVGYKYRQVYTSFWNKELPHELLQIAALQQQQNVQYQNPQFVTSAAIEKSQIIPGHVNIYASRENGYEDPVRTLKLLLQEPAGKSTLQDTAENMYNAPPTFGIARQAEDEHFSTNTLATNVLNEIYTPGSFDVVASENNLDINRKSESADNIAKSETTLHLLIALIIVFIIINVIIYSTFLFKRKKKVVGMKRKLGGILSYDGATDEDLKRSKQTTQHDGDDSFILDVVRKSNTYEIVKMEGNAHDNRYGMSRQLSTSTVDTHTKVSEWISNATLPRHAIEKDALAQQQQQRTMSSNSKKSSPFSSLFSSDSFRTQPDKVSVGIDATSLTRGNSVLRQEPIEISKYKMDARNIIICQDVEVTDQDLLTPQHFLEELGSIVDFPLQTVHQHSRSDPLDMYCGENDEKVTSFMESENEDVNVTSRTEDNTLMAELTPAHQLMVIKRRNYPKVLPTSTDNKQDSPIMTSDLSTTYKRNSLPPNSFNGHNFGRHAPPMPPPRTVSTLDRKLRNQRRHSRNITTSPLMLAEDCTEEEEEPEITENTLIVGPLIPKTKLYESNEKLVKKETDKSKIETNGNENCTKVDLTTRNGVFQTFESNTSSDTKSESGAHHTEIVCAIDANIVQNPIENSTNGVIYAEVMKPLNGQSATETMTTENKHKPDATFCQTSPEDKVIKTPAIARLSSISSTSSTLSSSSSSTGTVRTELKKCNKLQS